MANILPWPQCSQTLFWLTSYNYVELHDFRLYNISSHSPELCNTFNAFKSWCNFKIGHNYSYFSGCSSAALTRCPSHQRDFDLISNSIKIHLFISCHASIWSQNNFAHSKTAQLSWNVQNFFVIGSFFFKSNFKFNQIILCEMGTWIIQILNYGFKYDY